MMALIAASICYVVLSAVLCRVIWENDLDGRLMLAVCVVWPCLGSGLMCLIAEKYILAGP